MLQLIIKDFFCLTELSISVFKRALMTSHNPTPLISRDETRHKSPLYWKLDKLQAIQTERVTTNWHGNIIKKEIPHPLTCKTVCHSSPKVTQVRQLPWTLKSIPMSTKQVKLPELQFGVIYWRSLFNCTYPPARCGSVS